MSRLLGGGLVLPINRVTASYTANAFDSTILADATSANLTVTLPPISGSEGKLFTVKRTDTTANTVTIMPSGSDTIDGAVSLAVGTLQSVTLQASRAVTRWNIVSYGSGTLSSPAKAATIVVDNSGGGDATTIQAGVNLLPAEGGYILVREGTYTLTSTVTLRDMPIKIMGCGWGTTIALAGNAVTAFTIPNGLTDTRLYEFVDFQITATGVAGQKFVVHADTGGRGSIYCSGLKISRVEMCFDYTAYDTTYTRDTKLWCYSCVLIPAAIATSHLLRTPNTGGSFLGSVSAYFVNCDTDPGDGTFETWKLDFDGDIQGVNTIFYLKTGSKFDGGHFFNCLFGLTASGTLETFGNGYGNFYDGYYNCHFFAPSNSAFGTFTLNAVGNFRFIGSIVRNIKLVTSGSTIRHVFEGDNFQASGTPSPDFALDFASGATELRVSDCFFTGATSAQLRLNGTPAANITGCTFSASGSVGTIAEAGAADNGVYSNNIGVSTGGGMTILGASTRVDGVQQGRSTAISEGVAKANANSAAVGNVGAGTDDLMTYSLPANSLSKTNSVIRILAWGTTTNNGNAKTVTLNFGSQTILTQALTVSIAGTWRISAAIIKSGSNTQDIFAELLQLATIVHNQTLTAGTQTDTAAITIKCTGAATADNDIVQEGLVVETMA